MPDVTQVTVFRRRTGHIRHMTQPEKKSAPAGYLCKMRGCATNDWRPCMHEACWSAAGAFAGILLLGLLNSFLSRADSVLLIGSFGASAVLAYGAPDAPLAQPRNLVGGHLLSAATGVACFQLLGNDAFAAAAAVSLAIFFMHLTGTLHPPGGATALIAVIGSPAVHALGYMYVIIPAGAGAAIILGVALVVNNLSRRRSYPRWWW
jgi:CBS-domain-containing membrane protein